MSDPLDDFNRRLTRGDLDGPATDAAASAAQSYLDARRPITGPAGSIDFGAVPGVLLFAVGILLFLSGAWLVENTAGGMALAGIAAVVVSAGLMLVGAGALAVASLRKAGGIAAALAGRTWLFLAVAVSVAWWLAPTLWSWLWSLGLPLPRRSVWAIALVVAVVTWLLLQRLYGALAAGGTESR